MRDSVERVFPIYRISYQLRPAAFRFVISSFLVLAMISLSVRAEDKKPETAKVIPHVLMTMPLAVARGSTTTLIVRGKGLADATDVQAEAHGSKLAVKIKSKGKADVPKPELAEKLGDTKVEIELEVPADAAGDEVKLAVIGPNGTSESHIVRLFSAAELIPEKEPNNGFTTAQAIESPITVIGSIGKENDVDVFRISGKAGQKLSAEVFAARLGSPLDSLLTLYDEQGRVIAQNDDANAAEGDSMLDVSLPHDGTFYIGLTDALGNGGDMYPYLLHVVCK